MDWPSYRGMCCEYLPPYSPDLNPIELAFSAMKYHLHRNGDYIWMVMSQLSDKEVYITLLCALCVITPEDSYGWYLHCGYIWYMRVILVFLWWYIVVTMGSTLPALDPWHGCLPTLDQPIWVRSVLVVTLDNQAFRLLLDTLHCHFYTISVLSSVSYGIWCRPADPFV